MPLGVSVTVTVVWVVPTLPSDTTVTPSTAIAFAHVVVHASEGSPGGAEARQV